jgi:hypothetical protein
VLVGEMNPGWFIRRERLAEGSLQVNLVRDRRNSELQDLATCRASPAPANQILPFCVPSSARAFANNQPVFRAPPQDDVAVAVVFP